MNQAVGGNDSLCLDTLLLPLVPLLIDKTGQGDAKGRQTSRAQLLA